MFTLDDTQAAGKLQMSNGESQVLGYSLPVVENNGAVRIKVIGVGGAGGNVVSKMIANRVAGVTYININTDLAALNASSCDVRIQIGEKTTNGKGAGSQPEIGRKSAEESRKKIIEVFDNTDLVFITSGMGGGTGTGAAPVIAELARECGVLTAAVVTRPFKFEGNRKAKVALEGIQELLGKVDTLIVIPNEKLREVSPQKITLSNAFGIADGVLKQAVSGIADLLSQTGFINLDFADLKAILKGAGYAHMGVGEAYGKSKVEEAAIAAIKSPLMETSIKGAQRILIRVTGSPDLTMEDVELVVGSVQASAHPEANIIFGVDFDDDLSDALKVVVIATDFENGNAWSTESPIINKEQPVEPSFKPEYSGLGGNRVIKPDVPIPEPRRVPSISEYAKTLSVDIPLDDNYSVVNEEIENDDSEHDEWSSILSLLK